MLATTTLRRSPASGPERKETTSATGVSVGAEAVFCARHPALSGIARSYGPEQSSSSDSMMIASRAPGRRKPAFAPPTSAFSSASRAARKGCSRPDPAVPTSTWAWKSATSVGEPPDRIGPVRSPAGANADPSKFSTDVVVTPIWKSFATGDAASAWMNAASPLRSRVCSPLIEFESSMTKRMSVATWPGMTWLDSHDSSASFGTVSHEAQPPSAARSAAPKAAWARRIEVLTCTGRCRSARPAAGSSPTRRSCRRARWRSPPSMCSRPPAAGRGSPRSRSRPGSPRTFRWSG